MKYSITFLTSYEIDCPIVAVNENGDWDGHKASPVQDFMLEKFKAGDLPHWQSVEVEDMMKI